mgnify:CR=1 FL=1
MTDKQNKYCIIIEYLGKNFAGSQVQPEQITIQSEIEKALEIITKQKIRIILSGRTDSGVNAKGQVAHFTTETPIDNFEKFMASLNAIIKDDICIKKIMPIEKNFHSQKSAKYRW